MKANVFSFLIPKLGNFISSFCNFELCGFRKCGYQSDDVFSSEHSKKCHCISIYGWHKTTFVSWCSEISRQEELVSWT